MIFGSPPIVTNGLVLNLDAANTKSYPKSGTIWRDLSGFNNSGSLTNGPTFNSANGGSIVFDGVNDYVDTPYTTPIGTGGFTYSTWIRYTVSQIGGVIIKRIGDPTYEQLSLTIAGDSNGNTPGTRIVVNDVQNLSLNRLGITANSYNDGNWHNVVITRTSTSTILYVDGVSLVTQTSVAINLSTASKVFIGRGGDNQTVGGIPFSGSIATVQIYNRALALSEIQQNYNAQKSRFNLQ